MQRVCARGTSREMQDVDYPRPQCAHQLDGASPCEGIIINHDWAVGAVVRGVPENAKELFLMSKSRQFIIKVEARDCPDGVDRPRDAGDWEGKTFNTGTPQAASGKKRFPEEQRRNPEPGDRLLIWVNRLGLTAIAEVGISPSVGQTVAVRGVELLPRPRLNDTDLYRLSEIAALQDLAVSRVVKLRFVTHEGWNAIREAASAKIADGTRTNLKVSADEATTTETIPEPSGDALPTPTENQPPPGPLVDSTPTIDEPYTSEVEQGAEQGEHEGKASRLGLGGPAESPEHKRLKEYSD
jgi:hypothetical protein